jgi:hypothetical protein
MKRVLALALFVVFLVVLAVAFPGIGQAPYRTGPTVLPAEGYWCFGGLALPMPHPTHYQVPNEAPCTQQQVDFYVHLHPGLGGNPSIPNQRVILDGVLYYDPQWPLASDWLCWIGPDDIAPHRGSVPSAGERICTQPEVDALVDGKPWPSAE